MPRTGRGFDNKDRSRSNFRRSSTQPTPREPLFYFPPPIIRQTNQDSQCASSETVAKPIEEDKRRWVEFDFAFAREHFAKSGKDVQPAGSTLTTHERIERWNKWAGHESGEAEKGKKGRKRAMKEREKAGAVDGGKRMIGVDEARRERKTHETNAQIDVKAVLNHPDLAGVSEKGHGKPSAACFNGREG